jgi:hypothetical protein
MTGLRLARGVLRFVSYARRGVAEPAAHPQGWRPGAPDFVGVGVHRSGTSWWYELLVNHPAVERVAGTRRHLRLNEAIEPGRAVPAVMMQPLRKELHFFDPFVERPLLPADAEVYQRFFPRPAGSIAGEWTPGYMSDFWVPPLLARVAPNAKLLVMLRDPIERLRSALALAARAVERRGSRLALDIWNTERERGRYSAHISRVLRHFDREQLLVLQYERCTREPRQQLRRTYEFLDLNRPDHVPAALETQRRRRPKPAFPEEARRQLVWELEDDVHELAKRFPEIDVELWPNFSGAAGT